MPSCRYDQLLMNYCNTVYTLLSEIPSCWPVSQLPSKDGWQLVAVPALATEWRNLIGCIVLESSGFHYNNKHVYIYI